MPSQRNAFCWQGVPSVFSTDPAFISNASGKTHSETSSQAASSTVQRRTAEKGRSPGHVPGLTKAERQANRERAWARKSGVR